MANSFGPVDLAAENQLGTIAPYATPDQLKEARAYAAALQFGHGQQPVKHWTQGLSNMVASLMGGYQSGQTNRAENSRIQREGEAQVPGIGPASAAPVARSADAGGEGVTPTAYAPGSSVDDVYTNAVAKIESGGNPRNVTGSNRGLMQFGPEEERRYGITNWQDPDQQTAALAKERADHHARLVKALGRAPTPSELYLTHQQGPAGGPALLGGDPNEPAWKAIRPYYKSDRMAQLAITGNIPSDSPLKQVPVDRISKGTFAALWDAKYNRFAGRAGGGQPPAAPDGPSAGSALAFAGTPANPSGGPDDATSGWLKSLDGGVAPGANAEPGSPESMASALTPVGQRAPSPQIPNVGGGAQAVPPGAVPRGAIPQQPKMSREQLQTILTSPESRVPQSTKDWALKTYMQQFNPQTVEGFGGKYVIGPDGKPVWFVPTEVKDEVKGRGGASYTTRSVYDPNTGRYREIGRDEAPDEPTAPGTPAPAGTTTGAPRTLSPEKLGDVPSAAPGSLKKALEYAPPEGAAAPAPDQADVPPGLRGVAPGEEAPGGLKPVTDATGTTGVPAADEGRVVSDAAPIGGAGDKLALNVPGPNEAPGMLGTQPPIPTPPPAEKGVQEAKIPRKLQELDEFGLQQEVKEEDLKTRNKMDTESYQKNLDQTNKMGAKAAAMGTLLKLGRNMIENPKFANGQGIFADPWLTMQRFKAAMGGDPEAAALAQTFDKITSSNILRDLSVELAGTGQVRVAEIDLLKTAAANRYNTVAANRAVLDIAIRSHALAEQLSKISNAYAQGVQFDAKGNPVRDAKGNYVLSDTPPTGRGLYQLQAHYNENNPMFNKDELREYENIFKQDPKYAQAQKGSGKDLLAKPVVAPAPPEGGTLRAR